MGLINTLISDTTFGLGLLSSFGARVDVVGIYSNGQAQNPSITGGQSSSIINSVLGVSNNTPDFGQLFINARPMKATVRETSRVMEHPVESGSMLADFHIINPVEIDIPLIISSQFYASTYTQIRQNFINATPLSVKTRTGVYSNMIIADMPHEEEPEMYDVITIALRLKQVLIFSPNATTPNSNYQPLQANNGNTVLNGLQSGISLASKLLTSATAAASYASLARRL